MSANEIIRSPIGKALFAHVDAPDTRFGGEGKYSIDLVLDPNIEEHKDFIDATQKEVGNRRSPIRKRLDKEGNETGEYLAKFKSTYRPRLFNVEGVEIKEEGKRIFNDSEVKVAYTKNEYTQLGGGINFYLKAVQIISEADSGGNYGFGNEAVEDDEEAPTDADNEGSIF